MSLDSRAQVQTCKRTRVKGTHEDHSQGALVSKKYMGEPLTRSTRECTLHMWDHSQLLNAGTLDSRVSHEWNITSGRYRICSCISSCLTLPIQLAAT